MRGILGRSRNRCVIATTPDQAQKLLGEVVVIDLAIVELHLKEHVDGSQFISRVRNDPVFKHLPIIVYTAVQEHSEAGKYKALNLQNYFIKPYHEDVIHAEIARARATCWRDLMFEEDRSFCAQLGLTPAGLHKMREDLGAEASRFASMIEAAGNNPIARGRLYPRIAPLMDAAQAAGFWGLADYLQELQTKLDLSQESAWDLALTDLAVLGRVLNARLNPDTVPAALISDTEREEAQLAAEKRLWLEANVQLSGPLTDPGRCMDKIDALQSCPVIDTIGAEFQMVAETKSQTLQHQMELVCRDPGLSASVLIAANRLAHDDADPIQDPSVAVGVLGSTALASMARSLPLVNEQLLHSPPISWAQFWLFQMSVAAVALHTAKQMEFEIIQDYVYTAGLLHDIGKLLLAKIHPYAFQAAVAHSRLHNVTLHEAEKAYMGCTSRDLAVRFCEKHPMPTHYANVIRWVENPMEATEDVDLVAVVSLARTLCMHHHLGYCGDTPKEQCPPVDETPAWEVLRTRVYPSFNIRRFDHEIHPHCQLIKQELLGRLHK